MTVAVLFKLLAVLATVALGWVAGRLRWLGPAQADPARESGRARRRSGCALTYPRGYGRIG